VRLLLRCNGETALERTQLLGRALDTVRRGTAQEIFVALKRGAISPPDKRQQVDPKRRGPSSGMLRSVALV
jgi:hypothetical protein